MEVVPLGLLRFYVYIAFWWPRAHIRGTFCPYPAGAFALETASTRGDWSTPVLIFGGLSCSDSDLVVQSHQVYSKCFRMLLVLGSLMEGACDLSALNTCKSRQRRSKTRHSSQKNGQRPHRPCSYAPPYRTTSDSSITRCTLAYLTLALHMSRRT